MGNVQKVFVSIGGGAACIITFCRTGVSHPALLGIQGLFRPDRSLRSGVIVMVALMRVFKRNDLNIKTGESPSRIDC